MVCSTGQSIELLIEATRCHKEYCSREAKACLPTIRNKEANHAIIYISKSNQSIVYLKKADELVDREGGGSMEDLEHEMDGGPAGLVAAAALVDALSHASRQLLQPAGVDVLEHRLQCLAPDLEAGHHLAELERRRPPSELVAEEGASGREEAAVNRYHPRGLAARGSDGDASVGAEGEARGAEEGSELLRQAAECGHLRGRHGLPCCRRCDCYGVAQATAHV
ncbi:hypothetical protein B296_00043790, partial [Ensete ventricosum]